MSSNHSTPAVVVVGSGVLGSSSALALAQRGVRSVVVDGAEQQTCPDCLLHAPSLEWLAELGLGDLVEEAHPINAVEVYWRGEWTCGSSLVGENGRGAAAVVPRATLQSRLQEALAQSDLGKAATATKTGGGLEMARRRLGRIDDGANGVVLELEELEMGPAGVAVADVVEQISHVDRLEPGLVWAVDGQRSLVCQQLDVARDEAGPTEYYVSVQVETKEPVDASFVLNFDNGRKSSVWPIGSRRLRLFIEVEADTWRDREQLDHARLTELIRRRLPWLPPLEPTDPPDVRCYPQQLARRFGAKQIWLAGDAAHSVSPLSDYSLNAGLEEVRHWAAAFAEEESLSAVEAKLQQYSEKCLKRWRDELGARSPKRAMGSSQHRLEGVEERLLAWHLPASGRALETIARRMGLSSLVANGA